MRRCETKLTKEQKESETKYNKGISTRHIPSVIGGAGSAGITLIALVITVIVLLILARSEHFCYNR